MPPKKKSEEDFSLNSLLTNIKVGLTSKPNNLTYVPHDKQIEFHSSEAKTRQFLGGNRSGKSIAGVNETIWWLTGRHPYLQLPEPPVIGRIVTVDLKNGVNKIILPMLSQWLPKSELINGSWEDSWKAGIQVLRLKNGSEVEVMSNEQELDKFAGVPRHFIWCDEEPRHDIYKECMARLTDYNGRAWVTMTPVNGITWTYDELWERRGEPHVDVIGVNQWDNPHLSKEGMVTAAASYDEVESDIRLRGKYVAISGLVFKGFDEDTHVLRAPVEESNVAV